jgi:hypothetical protein
LVAGPGGEFDRGPRGQVQSQGSRVQASEQGSFGPMETVDSRSEHGNARVAAGQVPSECGPLAHESGTPRIKHLSD